MALLTLTGRVEVIDKLRKFGDNGRMVFFGIRKRINKKQRIIGFIAYNRLADYIDKNLNLKQKILVEFVPSTKISKGYWNTTLFANHVEIIPIGRKKQAVKETDNLFDENHNNNGSDQF